MDTADIGRSIERGLTNARRDLDTTDAYAVVNLRGSYRVNKHVQAYASIENALDVDYETFGLLGAADEVFANFADDRFFGAGAPIGGWVGLKPSY
ncbi:MAG: hypothetical protein ACREWG_11535 [Gammaproteobacteria bacterium]